MSISVVLTGEASIVWFRQRCTTRPFAFVPHLTAATSHRSDVTYIHSWRGDPLVRHPTGGVPSSQNTDRLRNKPISRNGPESMSSLAFLYFDVQILNVPTSLCTLKAFFSAVRDKSSLHSPHIILHTMYDGFTLGG